MKILSLLPLIAVVSACGSSASEQCRQTGKTWHKEFSHFVPMVAVVNKSPVLIQMPQFKEWCADD